MRAPCYLLNPMLVAHTNAQFILIDGPRVEASWRSSGPCAGKIAALISGTFEANAAETVIEILSRMKTLTAQFTKAFDRAMSTIARYASRGLFRNAF